MLIGGAVLIVVMARFAQVMLSSTSDPMRLEYEVMVDQSPDAPPVEMPTLLRIVEKRANSGFYNTAVVRTTDIGSRPMIEISIDRENPDQHQRIIRRMQMLGTFAMRVLAHQQVDQHIVEQARMAAGDDVYRAGDGNPQEIVARWISLPAPAKPFMPSLLKDENIVKRNLSEGGVQVLALVGPTDIRQFHISETYLVTGVANNPELSIEFTDEGADRATALTTTYRSTSDRTRYLAIIVDGRLQNAPGIVGTVSNETQIGGFATDEEVADLAAVLMSGTFPVPLRLVGGTDVFMAADGDAPAKAADSDND